MAESNGNRKLETGNQGNAPNSPLAQAIKSKQPPPIPTDAKASSQPTKPPLPQAAKAEPMEEPAAGRVAVPTSPLAQAVKGGAQVGAPEIATVPEPVAEEPQNSAQPVQNAAKKAKIFDVLYKQMTNTGIDNETRKKAIELSVAAGEESELVSVMQYCFRVSIGTYGSVNWVDDFFDTLARRDERLALDVAVKVANDVKFSISLRSMELIVGHLETKGFPDWSFPYMENVQELLDGWEPKLDMATKMHSRWSNILLQTNAGIQTIMARQLGLST